MSEKVATLANNHNKETEYKSLMSLLLKTSHNYVSCINSSYASFDEIANLVEQLQAVEAFSSNCHEVLTAQPDVTSKLIHCIQQSILCLITDVQDKVGKLKTLRNQSQTLYLKSQDLIVEKFTYSKVEELTLRTEDSPSPTDIALWVETLYRLINEDFGSRYLLTTSLTTYDPEKLASLCAYWKSNLSISSLIDDIRSYSQYLLSDP